MVDRYQSVFHDVAKDIKASDFDSSARRLKEYGAIKNPFLYRARYLLHSDKRSPYYDEARSKENLDLLDAASDVWGLSEKGRCLIVGDFYPPDPAQAEDVLTKAGNEPKAMYYIAHINDMSLHRDESGQPFGDKQHALNLYKEVMNGTSSYKDHASIAYCRIMIDKGDLSSSQKSHVFSVLVDLASRKSKEARNKLSEFLLKELGGLSASVYSESNAPDTMVEKIEFESSRRSAMSALGVLQTLLVSKS